MFPLHSSPVQKSSHKRAPPEETTERPSVSHPNQAARRPPPVNSATVVTQHCLHEGFSHALRASEVAASSPARSAPDLPIDCSIVRLASLCVLCRPSSNCRDPFLLSSNPQRRKRLVSWRTGEVMTLTFGWPKKVVLSSLSVFLARQPWPQPPAVACRKQSPLASRRFLCVAPPKSYTLRPTNATKVEL